MRVALLVVALGLAVSARQLLNEDQIRDELNYAANSRSKRALCGAQPASTPRPFTISPYDPSCRYCNCLPYIQPVVSKRAAVSSSIINPYFRCDYSRCCNTWRYPVIAKSAGSSSAKATSVNDASINQMASSLISKFGKRASDSNFKKPSVDLIFLIDDSGSIPAAQFKIAKEGAATLSQAMCPRTFGSSKGQKQVSVVLFSTTAQTVLSFEDSQKGAGYVEDAILNINQRSGATSTADALEHVRKVVLEGPGSRLNDPDTATIVFVVTDGKCNNGCGQLGAEAEKLRKAGRGVQVFAFGVGEADCDELKLIKGKDAGDVFGLPDFNFFEKLAIAIKEQMAKNSNACMS